MGQHQCVCPRCNYSLWRERQGEWSLANAIVKIVGGRVVATCPGKGCSQAVPVPFLQFTGEAPPVQRRRPRVIYRPDTEQT